MILNSNRKISCYFAVTVCCYKCTVQKLYCLLFSTCMNEVKLYCIDAAVHVRALPHLRVHAGTDVAGDAICLLPGHRERA